MDGMVVAGVGLGKSVRAAYPAVTAWGSVASHIEMYWGVSDALVQEEAAGSSATALAVVESAGHYVKLADKGCLVEGAVEEAETCLHAAKLQALAVEAGSEIVVDVAVEAVAAILQDKDL